MNRLTLAALVLVPVVAFAQSAPPPLPGTPAGRPAGQASPPTLPATPPGQRTPPLPGTPATDQPGRATPARFFVTNRDPRTDAIPVTIAGAVDLVPVTVTGTVGVAGVVQRWEYAQVVVGADVNPAAALNNAGDEGWELVSALPGNVSVKFVLKRPK